MGQPKCGLHSEVDLYVKASIGMDFGGLNSDVVFWWGSAAHAVHVTLYRYI